MKIKSNVKAGDTKSGSAGTVSIGSQSSGAGAGKISFNPFSITRR